jgi:transitional endoplasmic reticulum ATPase
MNEFGNMIGGRLAARVCSIDEAEDTVYVELERSEEKDRRVFVTLQDCDLSDVEVGDIVLLGDHQIEPAPEELWTEPTWVGVVQLKGPRKTVVKRDGELVTIPTLPDLEYEEGNTVEARDGHGVVEVISDEPLRSLNITVNKEVEASRFREKDGSNQDADRRPTFEDFGGMEEVVERAKDLIEVPLRYRKALTEIGARPIKGVLFTGPPGTGKTMLARIIAREAESAFYQISGPTVLTKWFGESEETLREIFDAAATDEKGSAIIFFDEIDSVASARGSTSHEASRSVVAQLLTLMDGFKPSTNVVVIAATNRPDDIDPALRRPGRFDWEIEFPQPDEQDREKILRASSRNLATDDHLSHAVVARDTRSWSAADLAAIWSEAALVAAKDGRMKISDEDYFIGFEKVQDQRRRVKPPRRDGGA